MKAFLLCLLIALPLSASFDEAWQDLAANRFEPAREKFARLMKDDQLARIGWFLSFSFNGPTAELEEAGLAILRQDPESEAAEFVLKWMDQYRECRNNWVTGATAILEGHQPANPELMVSYATLFRAREKYDTGQPHFFKIASQAGFVTSWKISERFGAYPIPAFEKEWPAEQPDYWKQAIDHTSRTGVVVPPREAIGAGVLYGFTEFENPEEQTLRFRLFSYQNAALYVDGKRIARF